jgi:hypothetical protein
MDISIVSTISAVGFPIVVAWYCLTKLADRLEANTKSNQAITQVLDKICNKLNIDNK